MLEAFREDPLNPYPARSWLRLLDRMENSELWAIDPSLLSTLYMIE
jgi:hypothetical protein